MLYSAAVSTDIEDELYDDSLTPLVPILPIEEDECEDLGTDSAVVGNFSTGCMQNMEPAIPVSTIETSAGENHTEKLHDVGVDVAAAASTAFAVLTKSMEQGSMIDTNLLIKIFSDPKMIQNLSNIHSVPEAVSKAVSESVSSSLSKSNTTIPNLPNGNLPKVSNGWPSRVTTALPQRSTSHTPDVNFASLPSHLQVQDPNKVKVTMPNTGNYSKIDAIPSQTNIAPVSSVSKEAQQWRDLNYYKNLVRQHGDQKLGQDGNSHNLNMVHEMKPENLKPKIQKQCLYFNGPKGCRHGANCQFKHDITLKNQNTKRMKLW